MNKQSNIYTVLYVIVLVVVVGTAMAIAALSLKPAQKANEDADKMKQILASVNVTADNGDIAETFNQYVTSQYVVNTQGERVDGEKAFEVNVAEEVKKAAEERLLPVYECQIEGATKYVLPIYGAGLWGPIWGYIAVNDDGNTVYGAFFNHKGETPGLGAEITNPNFSGQFAGKQLNKDGQFKSIAVVKKGQQPLNGEDYVDGVSGGTITSKGVDAMLRNSLSPYQEFFKNLQSSK